MSSVEISSYEIASILQGLQSQTWTPQNATSARSVGWFKPVSQRLRHQIVNTSVAVGLFLIAIASFYDAWLVYKYRFCITEKNAICRWLISLEPDSVSVFMCTKLATTCLVVVIVATLFRHWRQAGVLTTLSLLTFQVWLMAYLHLSEC